MIKYLVFDIGNVLATFQPDIYFKKRFDSKEKTEKLCTMIFSHDLWRAYDQGLYTKEDLEKEYLHLYPDYEQGIKMILNDWTNSLTPMHNTISFLQDMKKKGYNIYILSNISEEGTKYLKDTQNYFSICDGAVLSYQEKINKPDPRIFEVLFKRYQLKPEEGLYFDDLSCNIEQAKQLGMQGIVFCGEESIQTAKKLLEEVVYVKE